jgi:hypothetical protein
MTLSLAPSKNSYFPFSGDMFESGPRFLASAEPDALLSMGINGYTADLPDFLLYARWSVAQWRRFVCDPLAPSDKMSLKITAKAVFDALSTEGPSSIDLRQVRATEVSGKHLAILLRCTSTWRSDVPGWADALEAARKALALEGRDPQGALFGLE